MVEIPTPQPSSKALPESTAPRSADVSPWVVGGIFFLAVFLGGIGFTIYTLIFQPANIALLRDVVIIFLAFESILGGLVLVLLLIQLARLTSLIQDEIKPILDSTNDTVHTLQGTTKFLSNNLVDPVMKASSSFAAVREALSWLRSGRKGR
ncbi:MAG: hypothetical protein JXA97_09185 [Anaerolineales bacterium]|nr:hypothetical protein [Anaerolineales bacterium]